MSDGRRLPLGVALALGLAAGCYGSLIREAPDGGRCPAGFLVCAGVCVDGALDDLNCGACQHQCSVDEGCAAGACVAQDCPDAKCGPDQVCVSTGCRQRSCVGVQCPVGETCYDGTCRLEACGAQACGTGFICLDGGCTDVACLGVECPTGRACHAGTCSACTSGLPCSSNPHAACRLGRTACSGDTSTCADGPAAVAGKACGSNRVCDGDGGCTACATGTACQDNAGAPCVTGVLQCSLGPTCIAAGNADAGVSCGAGHVCDGAGQCAPCVPGAPCTTNPGAPCFTGVMSCAKGPVCKDGRPAPAGLLCGGGSKVCAGDGGCVGCVTGQACATNPTACVPGKLQCGNGPTCEDGSGTSPAGTLCGGNRVCSQDAGCVACGAIACPTGLVCTGGVCAP